jgi:hypothetical protein
LAAVADPSLCIADDARLTASSVAYEDHHLAAPRRDIAGNRDPWWRRRGCEGPLPDATIASDPVAPSRFVRPRASHSRQRGLGFPMAHASSRRQPYPFGDSLVDKHRPFLPPHLRLSVIVASVSYCWAICRSCLRNAGCRAASASTRIRAASCRYRSARCRRDSIFSRSLAATPFSVSRHS